MWIFENRSYKYFITINWVIHEETLGTCPTDENNKKRSNKHRSAIASSAFYS